METLRRVLGIDPGKHNCFWGLFVEATYLRYKLRLEETGQVDMLPDSLLNSRLDQIKNQIVSLLERKKPHLVVAERYIPRRGGVRGNLAEHVNIFLGILWAEAFRKGIPVNLITASQHKTRRPSNWYSLWPELNVHQMDAASIAYFGYCNLVK